jgi:hypothetical protein
MMRMADVNLPGHDSSRISGEAGRNPHALHLDHFKARVRHIAGPSLG